MTSTETTATSIISTRHFSAPPDVVFAAWIEADQIAQWWGPIGFTTTVHAIDARPGGEWRFTMLGPDGQAFAGIIRYIEITPPNRLVYEHLDDAGASMFPVVVIFDDHEGGTLLTMEMQFRSPEQRQEMIDYGVEKGNTETLGRLDDLLISG